MNDEATTYRERTPWPVWAGAIYWGALGGTGLLLLSGYDTDMPIGTRSLSVGAILVGALLLESVIKGLTVAVQETRLYLHLGSRPVIKRIVPYGDIVGLESVTYRPLLDFGGWGVRGIGKEKAWTARGNRAVRLTLADGNRLYIGSDNPQRLEERIRTAAGDLLAHG